MILYGAILILSRVGYADVEEIKNFSNNTNFLGKPNLGRIDNHGGDPSAIEAAIPGKAKESKINKPIYNSDAFSDEMLMDSEKLALRMLEQSQILCRISQEYRQRGELNRAIDLLDQAYVQIAGIDTSESDYLNEKKEDLRLTISRRIIEIYALRKSGIDAGQSEIPITLNRQVQHEIDLYTKGDLRNHFIASYRRSGKYRPMIVNKLKEADLPEELSWLPLVESGFKAKALSKSRALGLWQFIPSTGYQFGLNRDRYIDDRLNPDKSTRAAIDYLKKLHGQFGDWSTVLAAYNCGENRVWRSIQNMKINYLDSFWDLYAHLPQETARYVPKFIATLHIVGNLKKYGLENIKVDSPLKFESLAVTKKIHLKFVSDITGIEANILEALNPELRQKIVPGGRYALKIPAGSKQTLLADLDQILRLNPAQVKFIKHRVQLGETLSVIARRYRASIANIMLANNLRRTNYIVAGKTLKIPQKLKTSEPLKIGY